MLKFVDPDAWVIYFAGNRMQGYADGEFLTYERMTAAFQSVVGSDGEVARSRSNDKRLKVVIKLLQSSSSNLFLSTLHNSDLNAPNGAGVGTFQIMDLQGSTIIRSDQCWITKTPDGSLDRTAKSREWELECADADVTEGGN